MFLKNSFRQVPHIPSPSRILVGIGGLKHTIGPTNNCFFEIHRNVSTCPAFVNAVADALSAPVDIAKIVAYLVFYGQQGVTVLSADANWVAAPSQK